jgi:hypothetical protein
MNFSDAIPSNNGNPSGLGAFDSTEAAPEFAPLPPGVYVARVQKGEFTTTRTGADAYRIRFEVTEGPHAGRTVIRTWSFSERALPYAKRDLAQFGLTTAAQLLSPFPPLGKEFRVRLVVALQRCDDGREFNDIKRIELVRVDESPVAATTPPTAGGLPPQLARFTARTEGGSS